jgi:hypothetical protein
MRFIKLNPNQKGGLHEKAFGEGSSAWNEVTSYQGVASLIEIDGFASPLFARSWKYHKYTYKQI